jgi:hypothetical protein
MPGILVTLRSGLAVLGAIAFAAPAMAAPTALPNPVPLVVDSSPAGAAARSGDAAVTDVHYRGRHWRGRRNWSRRYNRRQFRRHYRRHHRGPVIYFSVPTYRYVPRRHYRSYGRSSAHVRWCYRHYRSYREWDNTFQPYHGPRRPCRSPYYW